MTTDHALRRAIIADPEDDTHRLVWADWLDENGQEERAELVRRQVSADGGQCHQCHAAELGEQHANGPCRCMPAWKDMVAFSGHALARSGHAWLPLATWPVCCRASGRTVSVGRAKGKGPAYWAFTFRRGLAHSCRMTGAEWMQVGHTVVKAAPVRHVRLDVAPELWTVPAKGGTVLKLQGGTQSLFVEGGWGRADRFEGPRDLRPVMALLEKEWPGMRFDVSHSWME